MSNLNFIYATGPILALALTFTGCEKSVDPVASAPPASAPQLTAEDCNKLADPSPADGSATSRATAVSQGVAARAACVKGLARVDGSNADLARIREIKELELATKAASEKSNKEYFKGFNASSGTPIKQYK